MELWTRILKQLKTKQKTMLLAVVSHKGSSPGKQGFKMMVSEDGTLYGSIGGGLTEFNLVDRARMMLRNTEQNPVLIRQVHRANTVDSSGMICAGEQFVAICPLSEKLIPDIEKIIRDEQGILSINQDQLLTGFGAFDEPISFVYNTPDSWQYTEGINRLPHLFIIGGGHVGLAVSRLFKTLDFRITIIDNRAGLNTFVENKYTDYKFIIDYKNIAGYIPAGKSNYVVVMTHRYDDDELIIRSLADKPFAYLGLLGSRSKIKTLFKNLIAAGTAASFLNKIDAPVGISINSKTPSEIAVSIAARIIAIKNG